MQGPTRNRQVLVVAMIAMGAVVLWLARRPAMTADDSADPGLVDGRLWVSTRPEKLTDYVHAAVFVGQANLGVFERASSYDVRFEFFDMTRDAKSIRATFPQSGRSASFKYSVRTCSELKPFDLCLDVSPNPWGGPRRYYGFSKPEDEDQALGPLAQRLRATLRERPGLR
jgi:hypothetical protein